MGRFDGILICTDLDGTLLTDDKRISKENLDAIEYFKSEGGYFTFITGRMPFYVGDMYDAARPNAPIGCVNGGGVYDFKTDCYLWTAELSRRAFPMIDAAAASVPETGIQISTFRNAYFPVDSEAMMHFREVTGVPNKKKSWYDVDEPIAKVLFGDTDEERLGRVMEILYNHPLSAEFDLIRSEMTLFEILPKGVNKGAVIPKIAEAVGVLPSHSIALGDYDNDIAMLKAAGVGIAVANAKDHVKAAADRVTVSNMEHAIARTVMEIDEGMIKFD